MFNGYVDICYIFSRKQLEKQTAKIIEAVCFFSYV